MTEKHDTEELEELEEVTKRFYEEYDVELFFADKGTSGTFAVLERVTGNSNYSIYFCILLVNTCSNIDLINHQ